MAKKVEEKRKYIDERRILVRESTCSVHGFQEVVVLKNIFIFLGFSRNSMVGIATGKKSCS